MKIPLLCIVLGASIGAAACGSSDYDWQRAMAANTLASYQGFVKNHPRSDEADTARGFILALQEDQAWKSAQGGGSKQSYESYLTAYPGGVHADQAHFEITGLERAEAWRAVQSNADDAALLAFLKRYPKGRESNLARARLAGYSYRVRFASARTHSAADHQLSILQVRLRNEVQSLVVISPSIADKDYQVTSGMLSKEQAQSMCAAAARVHQRCEVLVNDAPKT